MDRKGMPVSVDLGEGVLEEVFDCLGVPRVGSEDIVPHLGHSNRILELRVDGRRLMVKSGGEAWSARRFRSARAASRKIRKETDLRSPVFLDVAPQIGDCAVLAWWKLDFPTLSEAWPALQREEREEALRSLGDVLARLHAVPVERWGPLSATEEAPPTLREHLQQDVGGRIRHAALGVWADGLPLVDAFLERSADLDGDGSPRLSHNDPHLSNVLCSVDEEIPRCIGLIDLEAAGGALPESDLAYMELVHSPLMAGDLFREWLDHVIEGYGRAPDPSAMRLFRLHHILNIGIHAALTGDVEKAEHLAALGRDAL